MISRFDFFEGELHHELFTIMADLADHLSRQELSDFVKNIIQYQIPELDERNQEYLRWDKLRWLYWVKGHSQEINIFQSAIEELEKETPNFKLESNPDFLTYHWSSSGRWESPFSEEELLEMANSEDFGIVLSFQERPLGPSISGLKLTIASLTSKNPSWAISFMGFLKGEPEMCEIYLGSILEGIIEVENKNSIKGILSHIRDNKLWECCKLETVQKLIKLSSRYAGSRLIPTMNNIVEKIYRSEVTTPTGVNTEIKSASEIKRRSEISIEGAVTEYLLGQVRHSNNNNPAYSLRLLARPLKAGESRAASAVPILCSSFDYLFSNHRSWVEEFILPIFESGNDFELASAWAGILKSTPQLPASIQFLSAFFVRDFHLLKRLVERNEHFLIILMSAIMIFSPAQRSAISGQLLSLLNNNQLSHFVSFLRQRLRRFATNEKTHQWQSWIRDYWQNRIDGIPRRLEPDESEELLNLLNLFPEKYSEAVNLAVQLDFATSERKHIFYLHGSLPIGDYPDDSAKLLLFLLAQKNLTATIPATKIYKIIRPYLNQLPSHLQVSIDNSVRRFSYHLVNDRAGSA